MIQQLTAVDFQFNDGGRSNYFKGEKAGDCVIRAIAIATGKDYKEVYDEMWRRNKEYLKKSRKNSTTRALEKRGTSPRNGNYKKVYEQYILDLGFEWVSCMGIGTGMQMHVNKDELPNDQTMILRLSRHLACYDYGVLRDTYDCSRNGTRGVYGYWTKKY